jgi:NAD(P)-dependent dehydrogenase (short-subunit alcohol dehydrogenase family)
MGRSHADHLAEEGAAVIAIDTKGPPPVGYAQPKKENLDKTARFIEKAGGKVVPLLLDARDLGGMRDGVDSAADHLGRLDVVIANAQGRHRRRTGSSTGLA